MKKILYVGETWIKNITHIKGYDTFVTCHYEDCSHFLGDSFKKSGYEVTHIPAHMVGETFPQTDKALAEYSLIVLSDVGSNTFYLTNSVFIEGKTQTNALRMMRDFVLNGGALIMIGGYMSFTGIDAKARYAHTPLNEVLPVKLMEFDDRAENSEGISPKVQDGTHPILKGISGEWPAFLGYNRLAPKDGCHTLATIGSGDVFIAAGEFGQGRSVAFASDCAPHWGTLDFMNWKHYQSLWGNMADWAVKK